MKVSRYDHVKKNGVDFLFFAAPWVKKGSSSFNSKVSVKVIRSTKRKLNQKFFNVQDLHLYNIVRYYFSRYNEDKHVVTQVSFDSLFNALTFILLKDIKNAKVTKVDLFNMINTLTIFLPLIRESEYFKLNKVLYLYYLNSKFSRCKVNLFSPYSISAEIRAVFTSKRGIGKLVDESRKVVHSSNKDLRLLLAEV